MIAAPGRSPPQPRRTGAMTAAPKRGALLVASVVATAQGSRHVDPWKPSLEVNINLDLAPEERFGEAIPLFNSSAWALWEGMFAHDKPLREALYAVVDARGSEPEEMQREINGLASASKLPLKFVQGVQALYEIQTLMVPLVNFSHSAVSRGGLPVANLSFAAPPLPAQFAPFSALPYRGPGCIGIVATNSEDGTVTHARNQDVRGRASNSRRPRPRRASTRFRAPCAPCLNAHCLDGGPMAARWRPIRGLMARRWRPDGGPMAGRWHPETPIATVAPSSLRWTSSAASSSRASSQRAAKSSSARRWSRGMSRF